MECDSCDNTCTKKDTLRMHKGVKHKAKLSNCDKCDYSFTKNKLLVMHNFRKHGGQESPRELCELCDFTCLTTALVASGFIQILNIQNWRVLKSLSMLCVITQPKKSTPLVNKESESMVVLTRLMEKHC